MIERVRILLVAAPAAPILALAARLRDPDLDVAVCSTAREALDRTRPSMPDLVIVDGSVPGREVFRLYGRLRASAEGAAVPIVFTNHVRSAADPESTTAPDYYLGPEASLEDVEQLLFSFLPESLVEVEEPPEPEPPPRTRPTAGPIPTAPAWPRPEPPAEPLPTPSPGEAPAGLQGGLSGLALVYLGVFGAGEVLAALLDVRLGLVVHAGLLLALFLHGANLSPGPERTFVWTLWIAPLTRIYGLAQPYAGAQPLAWWALTAIPMVVATVVAMRLVGLSARDAGLVPAPRELPVAVFMVPVGLALGVLSYLVLDPRPVAREVAFGGIGLAALIVAVNPGIVEEIAFRGVLQRGATGFFGTGLGVVYATLLYAPVIPVGVFGGAGLLALLMTLGTGALFGLVTARMGSVLSAAVAHASLALGLYVIAPYLVPDSAVPAAGTPVVPPTVEQRPATARPSPAGGPSPAGPIAPAGQPTPPIVTPAGQQASVSPGVRPIPGAVQPVPGAASPTPITLAPPLSPPPAATPAAAPTQPPSPGSEVAPGQIVVVRGTGGTGVRLRAQAGSTAPIITVVPEYTPLIVIGPDQIVGGMVWRHVRTPTGAEGWIAASFVTTGRESAPAPAP